MYRVYFKCAARGVLKVDGEFAAILEGQPFYLQLGKRFVLEFYSYEQDYAPLCEKVDLTAVGECVSTIRWSLDVVTVYITPKRAMRYRPKVTHAVAPFDGGVFSLVGDDKCYISAEYEHKTVVIPIDFDIIGGSFDILEEGSVKYLKVSAKGREQEYLAIFKEQEYSPCFEGVADRFEISKGKIIMFKSYMDMSRLKLKKIFTLGGKFIKSKVEGYSLKYLQNAPSKLRIYAFLEAVMVAAYDVLGNFLTGELMELFRRDVLSDFFGEFTDIVESPVAQDDSTVALIYSDNSGRKSAKHFKFTLENELISNVEELS